MTGHHSTLRLARGASSTRGRTIVGLVVVLGAALVGCGGGSEAEFPSGPPVGDPVLPDFVPHPPTDVHTKHVGDTWTVEFSSILVNVGEGDFMMAADRDGDGAWTVTQHIAYSESGADAVPIDAEPAFAGDGHEHWHLKRVATYRLVPLDDAGKPEDGVGRTDSKIGFCIYDFSRQLERGPDEAVYSRKGCGREDTDELRMGLSTGWGDTYEWALPGQNIDITDLADGDYRLWAEADENKVFEELTRDNNTTWVDFELATNADGLRTALVTDVGPEPQ